MLPEIMIQTYTPGMGVAPLAVTATAAISDRSPEVRKVVWCWRRGGGGWQPDPEVDTSGRKDSAHTYTFGLPGDYEIAVEAFCAEGTAMSSTRAIRVIDPRSHEGRIDMMERQIARLEEWIRDNQTPAVVAAPKPRKKAR